MQTMENEKSLVMIWLCVFLHSTSREKEIDFHCWCQTMMNLLICDWRRWHCTWTKNCKILKRHKTPEKQTTKYKKKKKKFKHKCVTCPKWTPYIISHNGIADKTTIFVYCLGIPFLIFQFFNDFNGPFMFCMSSNYFQCLSFGVYQLSRKKDDK